MEYKFSDIEKKWQAWWKKNGIYKVSNDFSKPKCYVLDMFPYPSGAGLHVGHPLGYIASDIYARYKRLKGFNVLHPMGYDAFGLPAEQYAIDHGIHPAVSTENNINNFRKQLDNIGFSFDWDREVRTSDPKFYKWTQWIFLQLFNSFYNRKTNKAEPISNLIPSFEKEGSHTHDSRLTTQGFSAAQWKRFDEKKKMDVLMEHRLAYCGIGEVNWCEALGTVLANDEVINGVSERGGYPVVKKKLRQWYLRITEYADRLLDGLEKVDFSEAMKEMQTNWIGKSSGAEISFRLTPNPSPYGEGGKDPSGNFFQTSGNNSWQIIKEFGRMNRKIPTEAEDKLWQRIRNNQLGVKVRRQHAIQGYIVDFALLEVKLVIEIDGEYHSEEEQKKYDDARTEYLKEFGLELIRFTNNEVTQETEKVINDIKALIEKQKLKKRIHDGGELPLLREEKGSGDEALVLKVFTTRPDTIFGVDFMVIAPEHELVEEITSVEQKQAVDEYITYVKSRSERERMAEKMITGVFTGAYALNPFNGREIPIWISEYVLIGYGTGAIMAVPCGDERDHKFAKHFNIPITNIIGKYYNGEEANPTKDAILENSDFLNGMVMKDAIEVVINKLENIGMGKRKVNYKMRDAAFSRQRYWGEPFPITWKNGTAYALDESQLPIVLPQMEEIKPGKDGEGPLSNNEEWLNAPFFGGGRGESSTMPGYAGSSWYFLRYMDPHNEKEFCDRKISDYWNQVDLYIGGTEHAVGHLLYSRMWTKFLFDLGLIGFDEPYKKLVNQGMIQGSSRFVFQLSFILESAFKNPPAPKIFLSKGIFEKFSDYEKIIDAAIKNIFKNYFKKAYETVKILSYKPISLHVDVNLVDGVNLDIDKFRQSKPDYENASFILDNGECTSPYIPFSTLGEKIGSNYVCGTEVEKMSKSKFNTVNPNDIVEKYGADTFRMYEMFLGPVEMSKPWDTKGIEGVHRFLKKLWRLFFDETKGPIWTTSTPSPSERAGGEAATNEELKVLHKTIRKIEEDTERFSFNTAVSAFMIATNELTDLKCHKRPVLEPLLILLSPYAPHVCEELWHLLGHDSTIVDTDYPKWEEKYLVESSKEYPVSINGKLRTTINISLDASPEEVEKIVLANPVVQKWLDGKPHKKIIYVKGKMVNVVL